jgi:hypothetical protein
MTPRKNLMLLAEELDNIDKYCTPPFEKIQAICKIWDQIRDSTPEEGGPVSMLYGMLENYAHRRLKDTFFELARYYEIDLAEEDDSDYDL